MMRFSITKKGPLLNCTVFKAATSQPRDCMANTEILLPTFLRHRATRSAI